MFTHSPPLYVGSVKSMDERAVECTEIVSGGGRASKLARARGGRGKRRKRNNYGGLEGVNVVELRGIMVGGARRGSICGVERWGGGGG